MMTSTPSTQITAPMMSHISGWNLSNTMPPHQRARDEHAPAAFLNGGRERTVENPRLPEPPFRRSASRVSGYQYFQ
jgi:hypothetical protein